jgi:predicted NUDIX family NTP pyrophosphohydrolase
MPVPLIKKFAKRSGKTSKQVEKMWNSIKDSLINQGHTEDDSNFYPMLVGIMKKNLGLLEEYTFLHKFKVLLGEIKELPTRDAAGVLIFNGDKILICRATNWGRWDIPKGRVNEDDVDFKAAAIRETKEETGLDLPPKEVISIGKYRYKKGKNLTLFAYIATEEIDTSSLTCSGMVTGKGNPFPEVDKYEFVPFYKSIANIDPELQRILKEVREKIKKL